MWFSSPSSLNILVLMWKERLRSRLVNHVSTLNMHKMGFTKIRNTWLVEGEEATNIEVGANDHEAETSRANQEEDDAFDP